ncbi:hypothetical protein NDU88_000234 [Pleurodeles waltl]|uniref:Uncharacterized protein n=1 Tax=Pleurodeles waltl TaxID=8319 RepID=A0AAV7TEV8_PLEWA|nr:hypothetical protein NDU88_000234 [Pleurodeles waltl]
MGMGVAGYENCNMADRMGTKHVETDAPVFYSDEGYRHDTAVKAGRSFYGDKKADGTLKESSSGESDAGVSRRWRAASRRIPVHRDGKTEREHERAS